MNIASQSPQTAAAATSPTSTGLNQQAAGGQVNSNLPANSSPNQTTSSTTTPEWISKWLHRYSLCGLAVTSLCFAIAIGILLALSISYNGFAEVIGTEKYFLGYEIGPGLAYTSLPVLIFSLYVLWFAAVIAACVVREPFIELFDRGPTEPAASANRSFFLEYSQLPVLNILDAFKQRQAFLLVGFVLLVLVQFFLPSLAAHLFDNAVVVVKLSKNAIPASAFRSSGFGARSNLVPAIETALLQKVYDGYQLPWTLEKYSFQNFSIPQPPDLLMNTNFTVKTTAYYGEANCKYFPAGSGKAQRLDPLSAVTPLQIYDRGCTYIISVETAIPRYSVFSGYVEVFNTASCPITNGETRIAIFSAKASASKKGDLTQASVVSCIPSYFRESGHLTVNYYSPKQDKPTIQSFQPIDGSKEKLTFEKAKFSLPFESQLSQASIFDTTGGFHGSDFGISMLRLAHKIRPQSPFHNETLLQATSEMFATVFANMASLYLFVSNGGSASNEYHIISTSGQLYINQQRLRVVKPVAIGIIAILVLTGLYVIWILIYVVQHKSVLLEDPAGVMGSTIFMTKNDFVNNYLERQLATNTDGRFWKTAKKDPGIRGKGFKLVNGNTVQDRYICESSKVRDRSWKDAFVSNHT